jgi:hypothetical protein
VNIGDLVSTDNVATTTLGGIVGMTTSFITNCQSHCRIATHLCTFGIITAAKRTDTTLVKNCQVGGVVISEYDEDEDVYIEAKLSSSNYYKYIYGGTTDWSGVEGYDGNTLLPTKPTVN